MWRIEELTGQGETAWEWYLRLPSFMRWEFQIEDREDFLSTFEQGVNFGGYDDGLKVIVHGEDKGEILEGHLFCDPTADTNLIAAVISYGSKKVGRNILIETPSKHKTLRRILSNIGYKDLGLSAYRGRLVETSHYFYGKKEDQNTANSN
jgi:hypothetical protein